MKLAAALLLMLIPGAVAQHMLDLDDEESKDRRLGSPPNPPAENGTCGDPDPNTANDTDYMCPAGYSTKSGASTGNCSSTDACNDNCCNINTCVCANGVAVTDGAPNGLHASCVTNGANVCASCNTGFHPVGNNCVANVCTCGNGTASTGTSCYSDGVEMCANCDAGYGRENNDCRAPNAPDVNGSCADPDPNAFGTVDYICPAGYTKKQHPADSTPGTCDSTGVCTSNCCTLNTCTCTNGNGNTGTSCPVHQEASCADCNAGYTLANSACTANVCTCANGVAKQGSSCTTNGAELCESCQAPTYVKTGDTCVAAEAPATSNTTAAPQSQSTASEASGLRAPLLLTFACAFAAFAMLK